MRLAELQNLVVALYLSSDERAAWARDPDAVACAYGVDADGMAALGGVPLADLEFYARSLLAKRRKEAAALLPLAAAAAGDAFGRRFHRYAATCVPAGPKLHVADLLAFARSVAHDPASMASQTLDVLRYEVMPWELNFQLEEETVMLRASGARLRVVRARRAGGVRWRIVRFGSRVPALVRALSMRPPRRPPAHERIASVGVFLNLPPLARPIEWYVPYWLRRRGQP